MSRFKRVALIKAHQKLEPPNHTFTSDLTEIAHLGAFIENDVEYVTMPVGPYDKMPFKKFEESLIRERFDFVGISAMTGGYNNAREFARVARQAGAFVTMGGYHPTALTDDVLADPNVDAIIRGEGEVTLRDLVVNGPSKDVLGLSYKENGEQIHNPDRPLIEDLDTLPFPLRKIRPTRFGEPGDQYSMDTIYSSRGCIAKCTFCANDTMNKSLRNRSPEHFVAELETLHDPRVKKVLKFWDSIFLFDPDRVEKIIQLMFKKNLTNFRLITESRSDDVIRCRHLMKDLKRVGFEKLQVGIESPDEETFKRLKKGGSITKHERAVQIIREGGMKVEGFFIIGHPHETEEDIKKYPKFAQKMEINSRALYFVMTPYPGTQIYREYKEKNLIESYDWDSYNNYGAVIHLDKLNRQQLRNMLAHCYGSTWGIPFSFNKEKTVPRIIGQIFLATVVWLFFYDVQGSEGTKKRNLFMEAFFKAGVGHYKKKRKMKSLTRFFQIFTRKVRMQIVVDEEKAFTLTFNMKRDDLTLDVKHSEKGERQKFWVTLDDLASLRNSIDMVDANAIMVYSHKHAGKLKGMLSCWRTFLRSFIAISTVIAKMGWRYLVTPRTTSSPLPGIKGLKLTA